MKFPRRTLITAVLVCTVGIFPAAASDPDDALIDAAKHEGQVTWYTAQIIDALVRPLSAAFERKYGIKVNYVRADPSEIALRVLNEARAGKLSADLVDSAQAAAGLKKEGLILKWQPDFVDKFPREYVDPDGYWVATQSYSLMLGYNTDLVKLGTEPQNWDDLLNPKWKGRMAWSANATPSSGPGFVGLVLNELGEAKGMDYLKQLARQNIAAVQGSARQVLDLAVSGEYAIALQIYPNHVLDSQAIGAPIARYMMQPSMSSMLAAAVTKDAPHPNAAKLLFTYLLSDEGQKILSDTNLTPTNPDVVPHDPEASPHFAKFRAVVFSPEDQDSLLAKWVEIFKIIFE